MAKQLGAAGNKVPPVYTRLDDEMHDQIVAMIGAGNYIGVACVACGINPTTLKRWLRSGEEVKERAEKEGLTSDDPRPDWCDEHAWDCYRLAEDMAIAEAKGEVYAVTVVRSHMKDNWTAAMTFLERRHPDRWKRRDEHRVQAEAVDARPLLDNPRANELMHEALAEITQGDVQAADLGVPPALAPAQAGTGARAKEPVSPLESPAASEPPCEP